MPPWIHKADLDYAYGFIKRICVEIGPGAPCSPQERARALAVKAEIEKVAGEAREERFVCAPDAFLKWFQLAATLAVVAAFFFQLGLLGKYSLIFTTLALGIAIFIVLILVFEFILFRQFIDGLYPKKPSENIVGILRPPARRKYTPAQRGPARPVGKPEAGSQSLSSAAVLGRGRGQPKPKRILLFGAHHDSALQFNYLRYFKGGYFVAEAILIFGVMVFTAGLLLRWLSLVFAWPLEAMASALLLYSWVYLPLTVFIGFTFTERGRNGGSVPGAIDNLSAVAVLLILGRVLKRHPDWIPADTEIRLLSFGCEEAGTRGSRAYVRAHEQELRAADAVFINFESIYDPEIEIFTGDRNGTIRYSKDIVAGLAQAADSAGVPHLVSHFPFAGGGTDALPFREKGIRAGCLFGMKVPSQMVKFYHQPSDNYDIVNPAALHNAARIALEYLRKF